MGHNSANSLFFVDYFMNLGVSFSTTDSVLCIYHLFLWSKLNFLHNSQWITLPTQSCLVLYSICANLPYSFIMRLIALSITTYPISAVLLRLIYSQFDMIDPYGVVLCCYYYYCYYYYYYYLLLLSFSHQH